MLSAASRAPGLEASRVRQVLVGADRETNYSLLTHVYRGKRRVSGRSLAYIGGRNALSGGLYRRSAIEHGASGLAGEFGHLMIDPQGAKCWSGREGCVETRVGLAHLYSVCMGSPETESFRRLGSGHQTMLNELLAGAKEAVTLCNHVRLMVCRGCVRMAWESGRQGRFRRTVRGRIALKVPPTVSKIGTECGGKRCGRVDSEGSRN